MYPHSFSFSDFMLFVQSGALAFCLVQGYLGGGGMELFPSSVGGGGGGTSVGDDGPTVYLVHSMQSLHCILYLTLQEIL